LFCRAEVFRTKDLIKQYAGGQNNANTHTHTTIPLKKSGPSAGGYNTSSVSGAPKKSGATASAGNHYHTTVAGTIPQKAAP
jgi:hypothetical protein